MYQSTPMTHRTEKSQLRTQASPGKRITQVKQSMDHLYLLIQQAKSMINKNGHNTSRPPTNKRIQQNLIKDIYQNCQDGYRSQRNDPNIQIQISPSQSQVRGQSSPNQANYHIRIDDKNYDSSISLNVSVNQKGEKHSNYQNYPNRYAKQTLYSNTDNQDKMPGNRHGMHRHLQSTQYQTSNSHNNFYNQPVHKKSERSQKYFETPTKQDNNNYTPVSSRIRSQKGSQLLNYSATTELRRQNSPQVYDYIDSIHQNSLNNSRTENYTDKNSSGSRTLQKKIEQQLQQQQQQKIQNPPTMTQIPISKPMKKIQLTKKYNNQYQNYPVTPRNYQKLYSGQITAESTTISPATKTVQINLQNTRNKLSSPLQDNFIVNKQKYLSRLKKQQFDRTSFLKHNKSSRNNRSYSGKNRYSLSPECARITNRLYNTKTNKQPCRKHQKYRIGQKRIEIKEILGQYDFIRRYLTDAEINEIMTQLQIDGMPQNKWPMKIVDIIYSKLRYLKKF